MDATTATVLVLACAESSLPTSADDLLRMAAELGRAADGCGVPKKDLVDAADRLSRADDATRLDAVGELGRAAAALGEQAATLARACDGFGRLVAAIKVVRDCGEEEAARPRGCAGRIAALWARWRWDQGNKDLDLEAHLLSKNLSSSHQGAPGGDLAAAGQGDTGSQNTSGCSAMQGCALLGSLAVLPYMGSDVLKSDVYAGFYRKCVGIAFAWWWCFVGLCVPCTFGRSQLQRQYARIFSRIGMLGVTIVVIFFCHWSLAPESTVSLWSLVTIAAILHICLFIWAWRDGDM